MENKQKHKKVPTEVYAIELQKKEEENERYRQELALSEALNDNLKAQIANLTDTIARQLVKEADVNREFFNQGIELQRAQADADAFEKEVERLTNLNEMIVDDCNMGEEELRKEHENEREKFLDIFNEQNSEIFRLKEEVASLRYERRYGKWWNRLFRVLNKA